MNEARFDSSLPSPYNGNWREAYRSDKEDAPRLTSYQAPYGEPVPFIYKSLSFSGGQSVDTAEYPFQGLWSNESLNQKPQSINVRGFLRGEYYLRQRMEFLEALAVPTSDDDPGFFDHPLWGRFKVVVENYEIHESANENGQCEISLTLKRAGVPLETRALELSPQELAKPEDTARAAVEAFAGTDADPRTIMQAFGAMKAQLLSILGSLQLPQSMITGVANEISGIANLLNQGIRAPASLAQAFINALLSIAGAVISIGETAQNAGDYFFRKDKKKTAFVSFLLASAWALPDDGATPREAETKGAAENLFRAASLAASAKILLSMDEAARSQMEGYWALYKKLENSIDLENPGLYEAVTEMRVVLSAKLRQNTMGRELKKTLERPVPLLFLSHYLGCDENRLRAMNLIEDSFLVSGELVYA